MTEKATTTKSADVRMKLELNDPSIAIRSDSMTSASSPCAKKISKQDLKKIKQEKLQVKAELEIKMKREELLRVDPEDMEEADEGDSASRAMDAELSNTDDVTAVSTHEYTAIVLRSLKTSMKARGEAEHVQKLIDCVRTHLNSSCTLLGKKLQDKTVSLIHERTREFAHADADMQPMASWKQTAKLDCKLQLDECRMSLMNALQSTAQVQKKADPRQLHFWIDAIGRTWTIATSNANASANATASAANSSSGSSPACAVDGQGVLETCYTFLVMSNVNRDFLASIVAAMEPKSLGAGIKKPEKLELTDGDNAISDQLCQPAKAPVIRFLMGARPDLLFSLLDRFHVLATQLHADIERERAENLDEMLASSTVALRTVTFYELRDEALRLFKAIRTAIDLPRTPIPDVAAWPMSLDTLDPRAMFCYRHPDLVPQLTTVGMFDDMNEVRPLLLVITHFAENSKAAGGHGGVDAAAAKAVVQFLFRRFSEMMDKYNAMQKENDDLATKLAHSLVEPDDEEDEDTKEEKRKEFEDVEWKLRTIEDDLMTEWRESGSEQKLLTEGLQTVFKLIQSDDELKQQYDSLPRVPTVMPILRRLTLMDEVIEKQKMVTLARTDLTPAERKQIARVKAPVYALENEIYGRPQLITERILPGKVIERRLVENRVEQGLLSVWFSDWMRYWDSQKGVDIDRVRQLFTIRERPQSSNPNAATDSGDKLAVLFSLKQLQSLNVQKKKGRATKNDSVPASAKENAWSAFKVGVGNPLDSREMQVSRQETEALIGYWTRWRTGFGIGAYPSLATLVPMQRAAVEYDSLLREQDKLEMEEALLNDARVACLAAENNASFDVDSFTAIEHADISCRSKELAKREAALERVLLKEEHDEARALAIEKEAETKAWINNRLSMKPDERVFLKLARKYGKLDDEKPRAKHSHRAHKKQKAGQKDSENMMTSCASVSNKSPSKASAKVEQDILDETVARGSIHFGTGVEESLQARATLCLNVTRSACSPKKHSLSPRSDNGEQTTDEEAAPPRRKRLRRLVKEDDDENMPALEDAERACTPCATQMSPLKQTREVINLAVDDEDDDADDSDV